MRIGFDAKRLYNNFTGLGNYSRYIVDAIHESFPQEEIKLFTPKIKRSPEVKKYLDDQSLETVTPSSTVIKLKLGSAWRSFSLAKLAGKYKLDVFHGMSHELPYRISKSCKSVVTVHDLIFLRYPQFYNSIDRWIYTRKLKYACREADAVVAISQQTKQDLIEFLHVPEQKIKVVYQGCHPNFKQKKSQERKKEVLEAYSLPDVYMLSVGTVESRKNALLLVKALNKLKGKLDVPLVLVGRHTKYAEEVKNYVLENDLSKQVHFITKAAFDDLPAIYQSALLFVYPSLFEGFGIPLVEAIVSEIPVITSTGSCFVEAAGPDVVYVNPTDVEGMANEILRVATDESLRKSMVAKSLAYVERFEPESIASDMMDVYRSLVK